MPGALRRVLAVFRRLRLDHELDDEIQDHLQRGTARYMAKGLTPDEARLAALRDFGGVIQTKEAYREARGFSSLDSLLQDLRHAFRRLRKSPGFTAVAVLTLALGIGANTAIFSVVDTLIFQPLPVHDPAELVFLRFPTDADHFDPHFSGPEFHQVRDDTRPIFSHVNAMVLGGLSDQTGGSNGITVDGVTRPAQTMFVSGDFFEMLGIHPYLGRFILPAEGNTPGADAVIVLSHRYWQSRFHGDRGIIGARARVNGRAATIVGIAPQGFFGPTPLVEMEAYLPLGMMTVETSGSAAFLADPDVRDLIIVARVAPAVNIKRVNATLAPLGRRMAAQRRGPIASGALQAKALRPPGLINGPNPSAGSRGALLDARRTGARARLPEHRQPVACSWCKPASRDGREGGARGQPSAACPCALERDGCRRARRRRRRYGGGHDGAPGTQMGDGRHRAADCAGVPVQRARVRVCARPGGHRGGYRRRDAGAPRVERESQHDAPRRRTEYDRARPANSNGTRRHAGCRLVDAPDRGRAFPSQPDDRAARRPRVRSGARAERTTRSRRNRLHADRRNEVLRRAADTCSRLPCDPVRKPGDGGAAGR